MVLKEKFLNILRTFQAVNFHTSKNIAQAEYQIQDLLLVAFKLVQSQDLLSTDQVKDSRKLLSSAFDPLKYSVDVLVFRFDREKYVSYLVYRSGLEFLTFDWSSISYETLPDFEDEFSAKCVELKELVVELDEALVDVDLAVADPFGCHQDPEDLSHIPPHHTWWNSFRYRSS